MNREERLKSYHARKVAERRLQASRSKESELAKSNAKEAPSATASSAKSSTADLQQTTSTKPAATTPPPSRQTPKIRSETKPIDDELVKVFMGRRRMAKAEMNSAVAGNTGTGYGGGAVKIDGGSKADIISSVDSEIKISDPDKHPSGSKADNVKINGNTTSTSSIAKSASGNTNSTKKSGSRNATSSNSRKALQMYGKKKVAQKTTAIVEGGSKSEELSKKEVAPVGQTKAKETVVDVDNKKNCEKKEDVPSTNGVVADQKESENNMKDRSHDSTKDTTSKLTTNPNQDIQQNTIYKPPSSPKAREKTVRFLSPNPQCSPPRHRLAEDQVKAVEEVSVEGQAKVGTEDICAEEDADFLLFIAGLKREVAGDHTEVSDSFTIFRSSMFKVCN